MCQLIFRTKLGQQKKIVKHSVSVVYDLVLLAKKYYKKTENFSCKRIVKIKIDNKIKNEITSNKLSM